MVAPMGGRPRFDQNYTFKQRSFRRLAPTCFVARSSWGLPSAFHNEFAFLEGGVGLANMLYNTLMGR